MARWRLLNAHYLNVPGTEWEYKEISNAGKQARRVAPVPLFLDPKDQADWNYRDTGDIIVCNGNNPQSRDIIFEGPPTPDMEPLDEEAQAISDKHKASWIHPIESLSGQGYSQSLLNNFEAQLAAAIAGQPAKPTVVKGVDPAEFEAVKQQLAALIARNAELEAAAPTRRV